MLELGQSRSLPRLLLLADYREGNPGFIIPLYLVSVGIPIVQVGLALAVNGISVLIFEVLWGVLIDRVEAENTLPWLVGLTAVAYLVFPLVRSAEAAVAAEFLLGATAPAMAVITRAVVARTGPSSGWARGFGLLGSVSSFSLMAGSLIGSEIGSLEGYSFSFHFSAALSVLVYLAYRLGARLPSDAPSLKNNNSKEGVGGAAQPPTGLRPSLAWFGLPLICAVAVPTFMGLAFFTSLVQVVVTQSASISASTTQAGEVVAAFYLSSGAFQPILARRGGGSRKAMGRGRASREPRRVHPAHQDEQRVGSDGCVVRGGVVLCHCEPAVALAARGRGTEAVLWAGHRCQRCS